MPFFDSILNGGLWSPSIVAADAEQKAIGPMTPTVSAQNSVDTPELKTDLSNDAKALSDVRAFLNLSK